MIDILSGHVFTFTLGEDAMPLRYVSKLLLLGVIVTCGSGCSMFVDQPAYRVVQGKGDFQVRDYDSTIVAETIVDTPFEEAGGKAFERLFGYISGDNRARADISMTAPVTQSANPVEIDMTAPVEQRKTGTGWAVSFVMPASYTLESLPEPTNPEVTLRVVPARRVAVIEYSGTWTGERYRRHLEKLREWIAEENLEIEGEPVWARYNPPFTPWFLRRNEIMIPVHNE
ncbi:heme-binding protein [Halospina sp. K52047b]|nr:heme-binding protein [Halospina sp. K52047b]